MLPGNNTGLRHQFSVLPTAKLWKKHAEKVDLKKI
jgi:hypothetical protein